MTIVNKKFQLTFFIFSCSNSFKLISDPTDAFNVTKTGGIIFIQNNTNLAEAFLNTPHEIVIGTNRGKEFTIKVTIEEAERNCSDADIYLLCSQHEFQDDCESACGYGSKNGRCKWHAMREDGLNDGRTLYPNTCVPDIDKCPNNECDALERFASKLSKDEEHPFYICSQDCTRKLQGSLRQDKQGVGRVRKDFMCACFEDEICHCDKGHRTTTTSTIVPIVAVDDENVTNNNPTVDREFFSRHPDCGIACIMVSYMTRIKLKFVKAKLIPD